MRHAFGVDVAAPSALSPANGYVPVLGKRSPTRHHLGDHHVVVRVSTRHDTYPVDGGHPRSRSLDGTLTSRGLLVGLTQYPVLEVGFEEHVAATALVLGHARADESVRDIAAAIYELDTHGGEARNHPDRSLMGGTRRTRLSALTTNADPYDLDLRKLAEVSVHQDRGSARPNALTHLRRASAEKDHRDGSAHDTTHTQSS